MKKIIHQLWIGSELPAGLARCVQSWRDMHPDWEHRLWTEKDLARLRTPYDDLIARAADYVPEDAINQFKSDLYRWVILQEHGGLWADTDTWPLKPIDELITSDAVFGWEIQDRWIGTSTFYIDKAHPLLDRIIEHVTRLVIESTPPTRPNRLTGPKAISPVVRPSGAQILDEKVLFPVRWDDPMAADGDHGPETYVVHAWGHQRELRGLPVPGDAA